MKKLLLAIGVFALINTQEVNAQAFSENFNSGIPSTWTMIKVDNNTISTNLVSQIQTGLATNAWMSWTRATGDLCALTTSWFTPAGTADRWLITPSFQVTSPNMVLSWEDLAGDATYTDSLQVLVSPTAGTTTGSFTSTLYNNAAHASGFTKSGISLGAYNGQTIRIAFRDHSTDELVLMLDNVAAAVLPAVDGAVASVTFPKIAAAGSQVVATVTNQGAQTITSVTLNYVVDAGTPVSQTFTGLNILPYQTTNVTFTTGVTSAQGPHTLTVNLTQTNSATDPVTTNNTASATFTIPGAAVTRNGLIEEFSSSTCAPCASFNSTFDPLCNTNNVNVPSSHFNIVKYQMNWPAPGTDASYNPDGVDRQTYYGVNAIPDHYTNGAPGGAGDQAEINSSKVDPAYLTISGTYTVKGDSLIAVVTLTPNFTLTSANFKLYMAATETHYQNAANTTGQLDYYNVMRKMLPDGNGITVNTFTSGVPQTFTQRYKYISGSVTQNSYNFWGSPFAGHLVAYVQDPATGSMVQSVSIPAQWPTSVTNLNGGLGNASLYPNPTKEDANLVFTLDKSSSVSVNVIDIKGQVVYTTSNNMTAGAQHLFIPVTNLAAGTYNVTIHNEEGSLTQRLTVIK